jgi:hypothetical protein
MQYRKACLFFLFLFTISLLYSCKKKTNLNLSTIKIAAIDYRRSGGIVYHYRITYDAYNNVDSILNTGGGTDTGSNSFNVFTYTGSSFLVTDQQNLSYQVYANTSGLILEILKTDTILMTYNGKQLAELDYKSPSSVYPFYTVTATTYQWNNGDIITFGPPQGVVDSYFYDLRRSGQVGDALRIDEFINYGRSYNNTSHLPVQLRYSNGRENYYYTYDSQGRISSLMKVISDNNSPNDTADYLYRYY